MNRRVAAAALHPRPSRFTAQLLEDPAVADRVMERMGTSTRRKLLVIAQSKEWAMGCPREQLTRADLDKDAEISAQDYEEWVRAATAARGREIRWQQLAKLGVACACPFIGFGCFDNSMMLLSGDAFDTFWGEELGLSLMASAALGGIVSGTLGLQVHGIVEKLVQTLVQRPKLTPLQRRDPRVMWTIHAGSTGGLVLGLCLGMFPLLWMEHDV